MMVGRRLVTVAVLVASLATIIHCAPKKYDPTGNFVPSSVSHFTQSEDQEAVESTPGKSERRSDQEVDGNVLGSDERSQEPRFGFLSPGTVQTSGTSLFPGLNTGTLKLDLGGVLLGALIGFGSVFILPKILHIFNVHSYDGYRRSEDGGAHNQSRVMEVLARVDDALSQYNIDSSSCMQRAVCTYVKSAAEKVDNGTASSLDSIMDGLAKNSILSFMLDGTSFKQAVELGRQAGDCAATFARCPFNKESLYAALRGLMAEQQ